MKADGRTASPPPLLAIRDLHLSVLHRREALSILDGISFDLHRRRTTCLVGESGCGKSLTSLAIMGLHRPLGGRPSEGLRATGEIRFLGRNLLDLSDKDMEALRGKSLSMIFQEPMTSLNPTMTIGAQLFEAVRTHNPKASDKDIGAIVWEMMDKVHLSDRRRLDEYPFQLSGGMRQRVMIAMALVNTPQLLIADEPTTALDVTIQAQVLGLLADLQKAYGMAVLFITHNLGVVAEIADDVLVMYGGRIVEAGTVEDIFTNPQHPYTIGLLNSIPRIGEAQEELQTIGGSVPPPSAFPAGCRFRNRCPFIKAVCANRPTGHVHGAEHVSYCWHTPLEAYFSVPQTAGAAL